MREEAWATCAPECTAQSAERQGRLIPLALLAPLGGMESGYVGAVLRLTLEQGDRLQFPASPRSQQ
jgi:hypothetical protein